MKLKQRVKVGVALLLAVMTVLTGCGKGEDQSPNTSPGQAANTTQSADDLSKPIELSVAVWDIQAGFDAPNAKNDTVYNDLSREIQHHDQTGSDYLERLAGEGKSMGSVQAASRYVRQRD